MEWYWLVLSGIVLYLIIGLIIGRIYYQKELAKRKYPESINMEQVYLNTFVWVGFIIVSMAIAIGHGVKAIITYETPKKKAWRKLSQ